MAEERATQAIERIERALGRIERVAAAPAPAPRDDGELQRLRETHQSLRRKVEGAIAQIDRLITDGGRA